MKLTQQAIRVQFLNQISKEHKVSFKSICDCMDNNEDDIDTMDQIFNSDDELSIRKRLVLLHLISRDRAEENLEYYKAAKKFESESIDSYIDEYKAVIIAALMSNTLFYVSACNWCGLIQREVNRISKNKVEEDSIDLAPVEDEESEEYSITETTYGYLLIFFRRKPRLGAAGTGFSEFFKQSFSCEGISGTLHIMGNDQKEIYVEFHFDEFQSIVPFKLELSFTTTCDKRKHPPLAIPTDEDRIIKDRENGITILKSDVMSDVDYSEGIEPNYTVSVKFLNR